MSTPRETVLAYYAAVDAGDTDRLLELFHPDAVYRRGGYPPIVGAEALRDFYENVRVIDHGAHTVSALVCEDADVAARGSFAGVSRDGADLSIEWADFFRFEDGLIAERSTYFFTAGV